MNEAVDQEVMNRYLIWFHSLIKERISEDIEVELSSDGAHLFLTSPLFDGQIVIDRTRCQFYNSFWDVDQFSLISINKIPSYMDLGVSELPAPGLRPTESECEAVSIDTNECMAYLSYDVFGLCLWCLGRAEEYTSKKYLNLDDFERFPHNESHAYKCGYLHIPVVDLWLDVVSRTVSAIWPGLPLKKSKYRLSVSHDIDRIYRYYHQPFFKAIKRLLGDILNGRLRSACFFSLAFILRCRSYDPYFSFDYLLNFLEQNSLRSEFFVQAGLSNSKMDADYSLKDPEVRVVLSRILKRDHIIGLHPSYFCNTNSELLSKELNELNSTLSGLGALPSFRSRMHYLRWDTETTPHILEQCGIEEDHSLGFARAPGFRCGTCFPYTLINLHTGKKLSLRINPLVVMDCTLYAEKPFSGIDSESAIRRATEISNQCKKYGGVFTILWHNSELDSKKKRSMFETIVGNAQASHG